MLLRRSESLCAISRVEKVYPTIIILFTALDYAIVLNFFSSLGVALKCTFSIYLHEQFRKDVSFYNSHS